MKVIHKLNGRVVTAEEFDRHEVKMLPIQRGGGRQAYEASRPTMHNSLGISCPTPERLAEAREFVRERNIKGIEYTADGSCLITSRQGRKELLAARGLTDFDGCYGD